MGRMYSVTTVGSAQTAQVDILELLAATGKPIKVHFLGITQLTEVGDAEEEGLLIKLKRGVGVTSGSGGNSVTPAPIDVNDAAAGAVAETFNTTKATSGTFTDLEGYNWNVRMPFEKWWTPETRPRVHPGDRFNVELGTTEADSITFGVTCIFEEI